MSQLSDPFQERSATALRLQLPLLGGLFQFETNSRHLLDLVKTAYAGLPRQRPLRKDTPFRIKLWLTPRADSSAADEPPALSTYSAPGLLCGALDAANFVVVAPGERTALVVISKDMLRFSYHARYELLEFCVFTLASRAQDLAPLHAGCVGRSGRGLLLIGASGTGKSTLALHGLQQGLDFLTEDATFVEPARMLATGIGNFLHVRADSLRFLDDAAISSAIRKSPVIRRRSGVEKFEVDLRRLPFRLARTALEIAGIVFLSTRHVEEGDVLIPLRRRELLARLTASQPYAAGLPTWAAFKKNAAGIPAFDLGRTRHPREAVLALRSLLA